LIGKLEADEVAVRREIACPNTAEQELRARRFSIEPSTVLGVIRELRGRDESLVGFYHSHPDSPAEPSGTDLTYLRLWPETLWVIVPAGERARERARGWWLTDTSTEAVPQEVAIEATEGPGRSTGFEKTEAESAGSRGRSS
jgi:proteasome lid subunit RPN8/RPN11